MALENHNNPRRNENKNILRFFKSYSIDIAFVIFCIFLALYYNESISVLRVPSHDGTVYLMNAHDWLNNEPLDEVYRPPLVSWIIAGIWSITGENWVLVKGVQAIFTIGAGVVLYILLRKYKGNAFAFGVSALTMINGPIFLFSTQIMTEGLALFFLVLSMYFLKSRKEKYWFLAGITIALTFASRYPVFLQVAAIFVVESILSRKPKLALRTISSGVPTLILIALIVYLKAGTFTTALSKDTTLSLLLSPYYLVNSINIWGLPFLLVPIALLYRRTYEDRFNYSFIAWFIVSLLFWSASSSNWQFRFAIQYTPAVYFLSILAIENIVKSGISVNSTIVSYGGEIRSRLKRIKRVSKFELFGDFGDE
jgi:4-amino-4-deoxy-L-arabinose transferase-like glycosyltransferase